MTIYKFATTGNAYDAVQTDDDIKNGDTLIIEEKDFRQYKGRDEDGFRVYADDPKDIVVVGLAWTWPVAVTKQTGNLHGLDGKPGALDRIKVDAGWTDEQIKTAVAEARKLGAEIEPEFDAY